MVETVSTSQPTILAPQHQHPHKIIELIVLYLILSQLNPIVHIAKNLFFHSWIFVHFLLLVLSLDTGHEGEKAMAHLEDSDG